MPVNVVVVCRNYYALEILKTVFIKYGTEKLEYCMLSNAIETCSQLRPDIVLFEMNWPKGFCEESAISVLSRLLRVIPNISVVAMTREYSLETQLSMEAVGAKGYVFRESPHMNGEEIVEHGAVTFDRVVAGERFFAPCAPYHINNP